MAIQNLIIKIIFELCLTMQALQFVSKELNKNEG